MHRLFVTGLLEFWFLREFVTINGHVFEQGGPKNTTLSIMGFGGVSPFHTSSWPESWAGSLTIIPYVTMKPMPCSITHTHESLVAKSSPGHAEGARHILNNIVC